MNFVSLGLKTCYSPPTVASELYTSTEVLTTLALTCSKIVIACEVAINIY